MKSFSGASRRGVYFRIPKERIIVFPQAKFLLRKAVAAVEAVSGLTDRKDIRANE